MSATRTQLPGKNPLSVPCQVMRLVFPTKAQLPDKSPLSAPVMMACQLTRLVVVAWFIWVFVVYTMVWSDKQEILRDLGAMSGHTLERISGLQQTASYLVCLVNILILGVFAVKVWQLIGYYIAGHIFDRPTVSTFRTVAHLAIIMYVIDLIGRLVVFAIVSNGGFAFWFTFFDVMHAAWALCLVLLAEVFSAGAAIAEEHSQIV